MLESGDPAIARVSLVGWHNLGQSNVHYPAPQPNNGSVNGVDTFYPGTNIRLAELTSRGRYSNYGTRIGDWVHRAYVRDPQTLPRVGSSIPAIAFAEVDKTFRSRVLALRDDREEIPLNEIRTWVAQLPEDTLRRYLEGYLHSNIVDNYKITIQDNLKKNEVDRNLLVAMCSNKWVLVFIGNCVLEEESIKRLSSIRCIREAVVEFGHLFDAQISNSHLSIRNPVGKLRIADEARKVYQRMLENRETDSSLVLLKIGFFEVLSVFRPREEMYDLFQEIIDSSKLQNKYELPIRTLIYSNMISLENLRFFLKEWLKKPNASQFINVDQLQSRLKDPQVTKEQLIKFCKSALNSSILNFIKGYVWQSPIPISDLLIRCRDPL